MFFGVSRFTTENETFPHIVNFKIFHFQILLKCWGKHSYLFAFATSPWKKKKLDSRPVIRHFFGKSRGLFWGERLEEKGSATLSINFSDFWKISAFGWRLVSFSVWSTWRGGSLSGKGSDLCKMSRAFLLREGGISITLEPRNRLYVWRRTRSEWWLSGINTI